MIATHLNPAVRADTRFRLRLQAEAVQRLLNAKDTRQLTFMAHFPQEVAKLRSRNSYGFQVHNDAPAVRPCGRALGRRGRREVRSRAREA